jgi:hypothetical protein
VGLEDWLKDGGAVLGILLALGLPFYRYYLRLLDNADTAEGSSDRALYLEFRQRVALGGRPVTLYAEWLCQALCKVDRFFGDHSGYPIAAAPSRWFGLDGESAPIWTSSAFDRCLMLALWYPLVSVFLFWIVTGETGPAEAALRLPPGRELWRRALSLGPILPLVAYVHMRGRLLARSRWHIMIAYAAASAAAIAGAFAADASDSLVGVVLVIAAGIVVVAGPLAVAVGGAVAVAVAVVLSFAVAATYTGKGGSAGGVAGIFTFFVAFGVGCAVGAVDIKCRERRIRGWFHLLLLTVFTALSLALPHRLGVLRSWQEAGQLLYFLGLLTLVNAPFDWLALGLTRGLLRKGLKEGGWAPVWLGCLDALLSVGVIVLLVAAMVAATQIFNHMAGPGHEVLDLGALLKGIRADPWAAKHWWVYILIVSTQFPSLLNLMIGATALMRWVPWVKDWCLARLPEDGKMPRATRELLSVLLAGQVVGGGLLGLGAQIGLALGLVAYVLPFLGVELLAVAAWVAQVTPG